MGWCGYVHVGDRGAISVMATSTADDRWTKDKLTGEWIPPPLVEEFVDWMYARARTPATQTEWAREHGIHPDSVKRWKRNPHFKAYMEARAVEINLSPERIQDVLDAIYTAASNGDVQAAREYLRWAERFLPPPTPPAPPPSAEQLTDEELLAEVKEAAFELELEKDSSPFDG